MASPSRGRYPHPERRRGIARDAAGTINYKMEEFLPFFFLIIERFFVGVMIF
ncbi:hypothetical protein HMPREF9413_5972 [Paenibacillus sp. HGF7]|nr:hypothetical protein HMPREF9413_5972 [Paenibacillus sp. HGF7]